MQTWQKNIPPGILLGGLMLGILATPGESVGDSVKKEVPVQVESAHLKQVKKHIFRLTVKGIAGSPGWVVRLQPTRSATDPETWIFEALGAGPSGVVVQMMTPWEVHVQLGLPKGTRQVLVKGSNKVIPIAVPQ